MLALTAARADLPMLDETDPVAVALGYVSVATKANTAKYPSYVTGEKCSTCRMFRGDDLATFAPCGLYSGKQVAAKGWCSAWTKRS